MLSRGGLALDARVKELSFACGNASRPRVIGPEGTCPGKSAILKAWNIMFHALLYRGVP